MTARLTDLVIAVVDAIGYLGVALLVALESIFPPIPSEVVLPLAGFVAGRGEASLVGMVIAATVGSVVGSWVLYGVAAWVGPARLHRFVARYGRWFRLTVDDLARAEAWFDRRSGSAVLLGRCVPLIRSLVSIPAGFRRMPLLPFTLYSAAGSLLWNGALVGAGALLGDRWERVGDVVGLLQTAVVLLLVAGVGFLVWRRWLRPALFARGDLPPEPPESTDRSGSSGPFGPVD